jgi:hypothetical protein
LAWRHPRCFAAAPQGTIAVGPLTRSPRALEYAFVEGESLFAERGRYPELAPACAGERPGADDPGPACMRFLAANRAPRCSGGSRRFTAFAGTAES